MQKLLTFCLQKYNDQSFKDKLTTLLVLYNWAQVTSTPYQAYPENSILYFTTC